MSNSIYFRRKPYNIVYKDFHTGDIVRERRRPPAKLHDILPTDVVELTKTKNEDYQKGDEFEVKHISHRYPNVVQLKNDNNQTTFVPYFDLETVEEHAHRRGSSDAARQKLRYLIWP